MTNPTYMALALLDQVRERLIDGKDALLKGDPIGSDLEIGYVPGLLVELFCCRSIGSGFAMMIVGLRNVFLNIRGAMLTQDQIEAIRSQVESLRDELFISVDDAIDRTAQLEKVGLDPVLGAIEHLIPDTDEELNT